jgi:hypothetical protein
MKIRLGLLVTLSVALFVLYGCGGGGGGAILDMVHEGNFTSAMGGKLAEMKNSEFFKELTKWVDALKNQVRSAEDQFEKMDVKLDQIGAFTSIGGMMHYAGPFTAEKLKDYFEDVRSMDIDEDKEDGQVFYVDKKSNGNFAYMMVGGGFLQANKDLIEKTIAAMNKGKDKLADDKSFQKCRPLVDMSATSFSLAWDELDGMRNQWKVLTQIESDKDFEEALDDIDGYGQSEYYRGDFEVVHKLLFSKDKSAEMVEKVIKENVKKILENHHRLIMPDFFNYARNVNEIKDLEDKVTVSRGGPILEIRVKFAWPDVEKIFKG